MFIMYFITLLYVISNRSSSRISGDARVLELPRHGGVGGRRQVVTEEDPVGCGAQAPLVQLRRLFAQRRRNASGKPVAVRQKTRLRDFRACVNVSVHISSRQCDVTCLCEKMLVRLAECGLSICHESVNQQACLSF